MAKTSDTDKIKSLQKHLEKTRLQLNSVPIKREDQVEAYKKWVLSEIARTEKALARLKE